MRPTKCATRSNEEVSICHKSEAADESPPTTARHILAHPWEQRFLDMTPPCRHPIEVDST